MGTVVSRGETLLTAQRGKDEARVPSPVDGEITEVNAKVITDPRSLMDGKGLHENWLYRLQPRTLGRALSPMLFGQEIAPWGKKELGRLRDTLVFVSNPQAPTMADGGAPSPDFATHLNSEQWATVVGSLTCRAYSTSASQSATEQGSDAAHLAETHTPTVRGG